MIVNNYASEMHLQTNETAVINSSTMSMNSRGIPLNKAKSQSRAVRGKGRIQQNNVSEVASYLADGLEPVKKSTASYSRYEVLSQSQSRGYMDSAHHRRETSISRILGKQQSEARLVHAELAKNGHRFDSHEKNSISSSILQMRDRNHLKASYMASNRIPTDSSILGGPSPYRSNNMRKIDDVDSSFSYLPSIHGIGRSLLASGVSTDVMVSGRPKL